MNIFILVAPCGCGKGTLGEYICSNKKNYVHIDAGKIVRKEILDKTPFGEKIAPIYNSCKYLDESIDQIIWDESIKDILINCINKNKNIILDGCFRSNATFRLLHEFIKNHSLEKQIIILQLKASDKTCINRILNRVICNKCSNSYSHSNEKEQKIIFCLKCNSKLKKRKSDTEEFTKERLLHFHTIIKPLLEEAKLYYKFMEIETECEINILQKKYDQIFI